MSIAEPVVARLEQLHDQWATFSLLPRARLLLWKVADGEAAMVEAFIAREGDDETAETSDLFLRLTTAFRDANTHGLALAKELVDQYDQVFDSAGEDSPRWRCPARREREGDIPFLLRVLISFRQHLVGESATKVAVWLDPDTEVADKAYLLWLQRLAREAPAELRFLALESSSDLEYEALGKAEPERVVVCPCALDMSGALVEIAERADTRGPGAEFRRLQTLLGQALELGQLDRAVELGGLATEQASAQGWLHLAAAVQMMLGAGYVMHDQRTEALKAYSQAERLAEAREAQEVAQSSAEGEPSFGSTLRLQSRLGRGAVLITSRAFKDAAEIYVATIPVARSANDARAELDCHRLASFCYGEAGETRLAWELGTQGLRVGFEMDQETRQSSTLPYLADQLLRLTKSRRELVDYQGPLEEKIGRVLGEDWRAQVLRKAG